MRQKLATHFDDDFAVLNPAKRFEPLIPVIDVRNNEYIPADPSLTFGDEYAV